MAGLKVHQKTFTVKFQAEVNEIGKGFPYIEQWQTICDEYLKRVSEFPPNLERKVDEEIGLNKLDVQRATYISAFC
jgi:hypothetical protein